MRCAAVTLFLLAGIGHARDRPWPVVISEVLDLVHGYAEGKENVARDRQHVVIAYDAMTYHIHSPDRTGRMGRGHSEHGPNRDGVVIDIGISTRPYGGPMALPQWFRGPYYDTHISELKPDDRYLFVRARFGDDFPVDVRSRIVEKLGAKSEPPSPVRVHVLAKAERARFKAGEPIPVTATLSNGIRRSIRFTTFGTSPVESNAETTNIHLADVRRDGKPNALLLARPELKIPRTISGAASHAIPFQGKLEIHLDVSKWEIVGGWIPGRYEATVRMSNIAVDAKVTLSVLSDPVRFVIE